MKIEEGKGNKNISISIKNLSSLTKQGIRQGFFQLGHDLRSTAQKEILRKPKRGRTYLIRRGKTMRRHIASAPGETPANLSGDYRRSVNFKLVGAQRLIFGAGNSKVGYAEFLETGTKKMDARPGLGNAVKEVQKNARQYIENNIERFVVK